MTEECKYVDKNDLQDEIISILFRYLIAENDEKDRIIAYLKATNGGNNGNNININ